MGYLKGKSKMSLITSAAASAILIACGVAFGTPNDRTAAIIAFCKLPALAVSCPIMSDAVLHCLC